jgi:acyl-CoA synthetase (AMP-forming)/AMP-acid ligase II
MFLESVAGPSRERSAARYTSKWPMPDDVAAIFYTSGSTRTPRGVTCRHGQMAFCTAAINSVIGKTPEDVILSSRPLSFDYGFYQVLLALAAAATLAFTGNIAVATTLPSVVVREHVTGYPSCRPWSAR